MSIQLAIDNAASTDLGLPAATFHYQATPPECPTDFGCRNQRWFRGDNGARSVAGCTVYRCATEGRAELQIELFAPDFTRLASVKSLLTATQLRDLAARLLRAADNLDAEPATPDVPKEPA